MAKAKKMLIMLAVVAVLILATVIINAVPSSTDSSDESVGEGTVMLNVAESSITAFGWEGDNSLSFTFDGEKWTYDKDAAFPVDSSVVSSVLSNLENLKSEKTITTDASMSEYGLNKPSYTFWFVADNEKTTVEFGDDAALTSGQYCNTGDGFVYIVSSSLQESLGGELEDFILYEEIPSLDEITSVSLGSTVIEKKEDSGLEYSASYVWFLNDNGTYKTLDTELVQDFVDDIASLKWTDCLSYNDSKSEYKTTSEVSVSYSDGIFTVEIGQNDDCSFAKIAGSSMVYKINDSLYEELTGFEYESYRPDEVVVIDADNLVYVKTTVENSVYTLELGDSTSSIINALNSMKITSYVIDENKKALEIGFTVNCGSESIVINFYRYDSDSCAVELNEKTTFLVDRDKVVDLRESVFDVIWN